MRAQVQLIVLYTIPRIKPCVQGPKDFSGSSRGASLTPISSATLEKVLSKISRLSDSAGAAAQQSSRCWQIRLVGNLALVATMCTTSFASLSKIPALLAQPKMRQSSLKPLPSQVNHWRLVSLRLTAICLYASAQSILQILAP